MKKFLLVFFTLLLYTCSYAQKNLWPVKPGENIMTALGDSIAYRYPHFMQGIVYFRDGIVSPASLNLNLVNGEMQFLTPSNDTMTVTNEGTIKYITILSDTFFYDKVYVELIHGNPVAKLAKVQAIVPVDFQKMGAYDQPSPASSINTASFFFNNNQVSRLMENRVINLQKRTFYLIGDSYNHFLPADKKNLYRMFYKKKPALDSFIKENDISFAREDDLIKVTDLLAKP